MFVGFQRRSAPIANDKMAPVDDQTAISTATNQSRKLKISSRVLMQKTSKNNTVEVYRYDPTTGKVTAAEADVDTWEERNTEIYRWLNDDPPPFDRNPTPVPLHPAQRRQRIAAADDDAGLVRMSSTVHSVPPLRWSGSNVETFRSSSSGDVRQMAVNVDGRQRSQSEHCVRMTSSVHPSLGGASRAAATAQAPPWSAPKRPWAAIEGSVTNGPVVNGPTSAAAKPPRMVWSPVAPSTQPSTARLEERKSRRCVENRILRAMHYREGIDY